EGDAEISDSQSEAIEPPAGISRAQHAEGDAKYRSEQHRRAGEKESLGESLADVLNDGPLGDIRVAEITAQNSAGVVGELIQQGLVEVELLPQSRDGFRIGALADHFLHRITGRDVKQQK